MPARRVSKPTVDPAIQVVVRPLDLPLHEVEVELHLPAGAVSAGAVVALPVWTPGSYLVRDYARFLDRLAVKGPDGRPVPFVKEGTHRWRIPPCRTGCTLTYRLFCNDLTVRTNHVDAVHAHLVGSATFLYLEGQPERPYRVRFEGWPGTWRIATGLQEECGEYLAG